MEAIAYFSHPSNITLHCGVKIKKAEEQFLQPYYDPDTEYHALYTNNLSIPLHTPLKVAYLGLSIVSGWRACPFLLAVSRLFLPVGIGEATLDLR